MLDFFWKTPQVMYNRWIAHPHVTQNFWEYKKPKWNKLSRHYTLNFEQRVISSVKNFQLVHPREINVSVEFGKVAFRRYGCLYQSPFSVLDAFCLSLVSLWYTKI